MTVPDMTLVDSSSIEAVAYDEDRQELYVRFRGGRTYVYFPVPSPRYRALLDAPSKGRYLNRWIKPFYDCRRA